MSKSLEAGKARKSPAVQLISTAQPSTQRKIHVSWPRYLFSNIRVNLLHSCIDTLHGNK